MARSRRWFRFTLRTLLVVVALVAIPAALVGKRLIEAHQQRGAVRELTDRGWELMYDWQVTPDEDGPWHASWFGETMLRDALGDDFCDRIVTAQIGNEKVPGDEDLALLRNFPHVETVSIVAWQSKVTTKGIRHLVELNSLRRLLISNCTIDDACVPDLLAMEKLVLLSVRNTQISAEGIREVQTELERRGGSVHVGGTRRVGSE